MIRPAQTPIAAARTHGARAFRRIVFTLLVVTAGARALEFDSGDSLMVTAAGAGGGQFHTPSGAKGFADGVLYASFWHPFTDLVCTKVAIRASQQSAVPFLHQATIGLRGKAFAVNAGFVNDRFGKLLYHRANDFLGPSFDKYLLWDAYGLGTSGNRTIGAFGVGGGFAISNRESGSLHVTVALDYPLWAMRVLAGLQSYESWTQDNVITTGAEAQLRLRMVSLHMTGVYRRYLGYGSETNATMAAGWGLDLCAESRFVPVPQLQLSGLIRLERNLRLVARQSTTGSAELLILPRPWAGTGIGFDINTDNEIVTWAPSIAVVARPAPEHTEIRIRADRRQTEDSSPTWTVSGSVWIDF